MCRHDRKLEGDRHAVTLVQRTERTLGVVPRHAVPGEVVEAQVDLGAREPLLEGSWDATAVLLEAGDAIERTRGALPYLLSDFPG